MHKRSLSQEKGVRLTASLASWQTWVSLHGRGGTEAQGGASFLDAQQL